MDNFGMHKEPHVQAWRNLVERWYGELTHKAVRRGSFVSVPGLTRAIDELFKACKENPKPFIWTATVEEIVQKIARAGTKRGQIKPGSQSRTHLRNT
jgi:hypothetical protein